jgi:hypothetical protein
VHCPGAKPAEPGTGADRQQRPLRARRWRRLTAGVIAPRKAWRLLQGESPCRVRARHPPVSSLASMAESQLYTRRTRWAKRRQSILEAAGVTAHPEVLVQLRQGCADAEGLNAPEGNTRTAIRARRCRSAGVLRPWHAGREASKNLGSPRGSCARSVQARGQAGRETHRIPLGCLITHSTQRWGKPTTWGRT